MCIGECLRNGFCSDNYTWKLTLMWGTNACDRPGVEMVASDGTKWWCRVYVDL